MRYERFDHRCFRFLAAGCWAAIAIFGSPGSPGALGQSLPPIEESGVEGGLAVWIGGDLAPADWAAGLSELGAKRGLLVLGLGRDAEAVRKTRAAMAGPDRPGAVSFDTFRPPAGGALPLVDNSVNLLLVSSGSGISNAEILRVLTPLGTALVEEDGKWRKSTKPWPADIDEWTHYLHDASNNAVSHDERVGPPRHLQWQCGPRWGRHHDHMASVSAMVSARGRVFYIVDEGSRHSPQLPPDWKLVARDAFNGVLLWKRPIARWHDNLWPLKSGPASLPRRLVAQGDVVYATLGIDAPVTALDAATGQTIREFEGTAAAEEMIYSGGTLMVLVNRTPVDLEADLATDSEEGRSRDSRTTYSPTMGRIWAAVRSRRWTHGDRSILAFEAETGRPLWEKAGRVIPLTLGADPNHAYYHDGDKIVALELSDGQQRWTSQPVPVWQGLDGRGLQSWFAPTLIACEGKVLFAGGEKIHMSYQGWGSEDIGQDTMTAFSADSGKKLWTADHPYSGYNSPEDLFVAGGKVWTGVTAKGGPDGRYTSHNLATGEKDDDFPPTVDTFWFHHRCYRAKATDKYILSSRTGIEFIDLATGEWTIHHWVRGGCLYGIMPSNGLVYSPLHPCSCYAEAKLNGFTALAASRDEGLGTRGEEGEARAVRGSHDPAHGPTEGLQNQGDLRSTVSARSGDLRRAQALAAARLERGPAYDSFPSRPSPLVPHPSSAWPTYRHDPARSGATSDPLSTPLGPQWTVELGGRLTQPVAGGGRLFVADIDRHTVHAVDATSGERLWSYAAGGRIDSPPTYDRGRLVFGSANGYVYCLRAGDGALAWRFRAAPVDRRLVAFDQVESVWPVHGAVLVEDGVVSAVAGRSIYLDGGLHFCRLDVETGRLLSETVLDDRDPQTGEDMQTRIKGLDSPVALPDVLASDGERIYMRSETLDLEGNRLGAASPGGRRDHLFAPYGFTDDSWFHRVYWVFGNGFRSGVGGYSNGLAKPAGRILVNNDSTVFGYGRKPEYYRWTSVRECQLFAAARPGSRSGVPKAVYFENSPSLDPTGKPLTVAAWIKTDAPNGTILVRGANLNGFALILTDGKPRMLLRTKETTHDVVSEHPIGADWTHVAGVLREDGRMEVYLDGKLTGTTKNAPMLGANPSIPMKIGYDNTNQLLPKPLTPYRGALDEVMLFHRALPAEEIGALAEGRKKPGGADRTGPVLHLAFSGGKVRDRSPHGNHGRIEGGNAETTEGPFGEALLLRQPKHLLLAKQGQGKSKVAYHWAREVPMMVCGMALAGKTLVIAGPPDLIDEEASFQNFPDESTQKQLALQEAALKGNGGAILQAVDADTGETLAECPLDSPPVFDGLIVAGGRVFLAAMDGRLRAFGPKGAAR